MGGWGRLVGQSDQRSVMIKFTRFFSGLRLLHLVVNIFKCFKKIMVVFRSHYAPRISDLGLYIIVMASPSEGAE